MTLKFTLKTPLPQKQTTSKANIHENAVIAKNIVTDTKAKRQKWWWEPQWESLYPNGNKTWQSSDPSKKWLTFQNVSQSTAITYPRSHKRPKENIEGTADLSIEVTCLWLRYAKDTGQKWHPWNCGKVKTTANPEAKTHLNDSQTFQDNV